MNAETGNSDPGANHRYPRRGRLLHRADFERVYKQGRRLFSAHMTVFYLPCPENHQMRVGFTVSRALGGAVDRNRMKRRLRECVRASWPEVVPNADVVINPKKSLRTADFTGLQQEVRRAFEVIAQKVSGKPSGGKLK